MEPLTLGLGLLMVVGFAVVIWQQRSRGDAGADVRAVATLEAKVTQLTAQIGKLEEALEQERSEKDQLKGSGKQQFAQLSKLEAEHASTLKEREDLQKKLNKKEAEEARHQQDMADQLTKLENSRQTLEDEKARVRREDEERLMRMEAERDRMWTEHEQAVISLLSEMCKRPEYAFSSFTNTSLPDGWDGSLKPDFMIEFLDQYVIFDAKVSKAQSLQTYVTAAVKSTVEKAKKNKKIAQTIFLVVPSEAIGELKTHYYPQEEYNVYVISPEAIPPILASLKRITAYEFAEQLDPQERENIVNLLAEFDYHVSLRNAADLVLAKHGTTVLQKTQHLSPMLRDEIGLKAQQKKAKASLSQADLKKIVQNVLIQEEEIRNLTAPRVAVSKEDLNAAQTLLEGVFAEPTLDAKKPRK